MDAIALGWKGLASNDAKKKKKKKFPSHSTCTYTEATCIILTRVYYCWGLPSSSEGYFVLRAALSLTTVTPPVSLMWIIWWCGDTQFEIHRPFHSEYLHLSAASMSTKLSDCITGANCPPAALFAHRHLPQRREEQGKPAARRRRWAP